jgi:hypothetical protein
MVRQARRNRAHSAVTSQVNVIEAGKVNDHAAFLRLSSGRLPFLGLTPSASAAPAKPITMMLCNCPVVPR